jgi:ribose transport system substrate-binding protein
MKRLLGEKGGDGTGEKTVAIVSHIRETATAIEREAGVRQAMGTESVTGTWFCENDEEIAYENTIEILKDQTITGIVALNEIVTLGVARAIEDSDAAARVSVVGFDNAPEELAFLEKGVIKATVVQRPYNMGYISVKTAVEYLRGKKVEPVIDTGSVLITAENMFQRKYQELLFPVNDG